ncbi:hypothetical protein FHX52_3004 [Humibacillus xanthopallidus]|uniref:Uncharacterized protein n=1 Tax=Humibacillus xanthopallidus TaxID=412689 RepID=A0A543PQE3_9MICO|nr:hypothetical protein [Humibacillus xanthopallidus]TQN46292.1 hypothetical protein FHX52_3004 [Humibacillus xanthopallidus]
MSAVPAPLEQSATEPRTADPDRTQRLATDLLALARNAAINVEAADEVDYWYRLGQRNAYAHATGLLLARELGQDPFTITNRVTAALDAKVTDVTCLHSAAYGLGTDGPDADAAETVLAWVGPRAFAARFGSAPNIDHDYGHTWGPRSDQRVSLRITDGADTGLLYVHDPTWDEYAVLAESADHSAVTRAFAALEADGRSGNRHLEPRRFAQLVNDAAGRPAPDHRAAAPVRAEL